MLKFKKKKKDKIERTNVVIDFKQELCLHIEM